MGRWSRVWPTHVEGAITSAIVDAGMSARKAVIAALDGNLEQQDGSPIKVELPEGMTVDQAREKLIHSAYKWAAQERAQRRGEYVPEWIKKTPPDEVADELARSLYAMAAAAIRREERRPVAKRELDRLVSAGKVAREAKALAGSAPPHKGRVGKQTSAEGADTGKEGTVGGDARKLLNRARATRAGTPIETTSEQSDSNANGNSHAERLAAEQHAEGILTRTDGDAGRQAAAQELGIGDMEQSQS